MTTAAAATSVSAVPHLIGEIKYSKKDGARSQVIQGYWAFGDDTPSQDFQFKRTIPPTEEPSADISGKHSFDGWFEFDGNTLHEEGVFIDFEQTNDGFVVKGRGENEFGVFRLDGTAKRSAEDELSYAVKLTKHYTVKVGAKVSKYFSLNGHIPTLFEGTIESYNAAKDRYMILYEDGGKEELEEEETIEIALRALNSSKPRVRKARKAHKQKQSAQASKAKGRERVSSSRLQATADVLSDPSEDPIKLGKKIHAIANNQSKTIDAMANNQSKMIGMLKSRVDSVDETLSDVSAVIPNHEKRISLVQSKEIAMQDRISRIQKSASRNTKTNDVKFDKLQAENKKLEKSLLHQSKRMANFEKDLSAMSVKVKNHGRSLSGQQKSIQATNMRVSRLEGGLMERDMHHAKVHGTIFTHLRTHKGVIENLNEEIATLRSENSTLGMALSTLKNERIASSGTSHSATDAAYKDDSSTVIEDPDQQVNSASTRKRKQSRNSLGPVVSTRHRKSSK